MEKQNVVNDPITTKTASSGETVYLEFSKERLDTETKQSK